MIWLILNSFFTQWNNFTRTRREYYNTTLPLAGASLLLFRQGEVHHSSALQDFCILLSDTFFFSFTVSIPFPPSLQSPHCITIGEHKEQSHSTGKNNQECPQHRQSSAFTNWGGLLSVLIMGSTKSPRQGKEMNHTQGLSRESS